MKKHNIFDYPGLQGIMDIPELVPTEEMMNFSGMSHDQMLDQMQENVLFSLSDRAKHIRKIQRQNLEQRFILIDKANDNEKIQHLAIEMCTQDPLYWINMFAWTYNPRLQHPYNHLPFITYPYQDEFILRVIKSIEEGKDCWIEKSRDMGFSWLLLAIFTRGFLFRNWTTLIGSYKEGYVHTVGDMDSSFERILYMIERTPHRMKPDDIISKFMSINSKAGGEKEIGGDAGQAFGTGGRRKAIFLDEYAERQFAEKALRKTKDVTNCRIFGGTPEGTSNVYGKVMTDHKKYKHMSVRKYRLMWWLHPLKTQMRYKLQQITRTKEDLAREIDISYEDSVTGAVYPNFKTLANFKKCPYNPRRPLYRSWDFGLDCNAIIWRQKDHKNNEIYIINAVDRIDRDIRKTAGLVTGNPKPILKPNGEYTPLFTYDIEDDEFMQEVRSYGKSSGDFGDPYNSDNRTTIDKKNTIRSVLKEFNIELQTSRSNTVEGRIKTATLALPRLHVHDELHNLIQAIIQSKYPKIKETSQTTADNRKPVHDGNSHFRTAFEYFLDLEPKSDIHNLEDGESQGSDVDYTSLY